MSSIWLQHLIVKARLVLWWASCDKRRKGTRSTVQSEHDIPFAKRRLKLPLYQAILNFLSLLLSLSHTAYTHMRIETIGTNHVFKWYCAALAVVKSVVLVLQSWNAWTLDGTWITFENKLPNPGFTLIAKFCVNITFFGCHMHFSCIAVSLCKMTEHWFNKLLLTGGCHVHQH